LVLAAQEKTVSIGSDVDLRSRNRFLRKKGIAPPWTLKDYVHWRLI
jgi:hypothetical protein